MWQRSLKCYWSTLVRSTLEEGFLDELKMYVDFTKWTMWITQPQLRWVYYEWLMYLQVFYKRLSILYWIQDSVFLGSLERPYVKPCMKNKHILQRFMFLFYDNYMQISTLLDSRSGYSCFLITYKTYFILLYF